MSVDLELTSVLRIVITMLALIHAAAMQATPSIQMDTIVMVRDNDFKTLYYNFL